MERVLLLAPSELLGRVTAGRSRGLGPQGVRLVRVYKRGVERGVAEREKVTHGDPGDPSVNYRLLITRETHH